MSQSLMIAVERAVRPVRAPLMTRLRMREELLAHLESIQAEEAVRGGTAEQVLQRSLARWGDPQELTQELQRSLNWQERFEAGINHWFLRYEGESRLHAAARITLTIWLYVGCTLLLVVIPTYLAKGRLSAELGRSTLILVTFIAVSAFSTTWFALACAERAARSPRLVAFDVVTWLAAFAVGIVIGCAGLSVTALAGRSFDLPPRALWVWLWIAGAAVLLFVGTLQMFQREARRESAWRSLDLRGTGTAAAS